jgi:hypothetical protein
VREVTAAVTVYDASDPAAFLTRWGAAVEAAPRAVTSFLTLVLGPGGRAVAQAMTVYAGTDAAMVGAAFAPLLAAGPVLHNQAFTTPYHQLLPASRGLQYAQQPLTVSRSGLLDHITPPAAENIAGLLGVAGMVQLRSVGGAVNDTQSAAMAYSHRTQNFSLMAATVPGQGSDLDQRWDLLHPHLNGLYPSFETRTGRQQFQDAFPSAVLDRLVTLKAHYDPDRLFDTNFALPSAPFPP